MEDNKIKKTNSASKIIFNALKAKINKFEALTIVDKKRYISSNYRYFSMKL